MYLPNILRDFKDPSYRRISSFCNLLLVSNSMLSITFIFLNISWRNVLQLSQSNKTCISFSTISQAISTNFLVIKRLHHLAMLIDRLCEEVLTFSNCNSNIIVFKVQISFLFILVFGLGENIHLSKNEGKLILIKHKT